MSDRYYVGFFGNLAYHNKKHGPRCAIVNICTRTISTNFTHMLEDEADHQRLAAELNRHARKSPNGRA